MLLIGDRIKRALVGGHSNLGGEVRNRGSYLMLVGIIRQFKLKSNKNILRKCVFDLRNYL